jgi:hypothetical protein
MTPVLFVSSMYCIACACYSSAVDLVATQPEKSIANITVHTICFIFFPFIYFSLPPVFNVEAVKHSFGSAFEVLVGVFFG